jgi:hypothetical protein
MSDIPQDVKNRIAAEARKVWEQRIGPVTDGMTPEAKLKAEAGFQAQRDARQAALAEPKPFDEAALREQAGREYDALIGSSAFRRTGVGPDREAYVAARLAEELSTRQQQATPAEAADRFYGSDRAMLELYGHTRDGVRRMFGAEAPPRPADGSLEPGDSSFGPSIESPTTLPETAGSFSDAAPSRPHLLDRMFGRLKSQTDALLARASRL